MSCKCFSVLAQNSGYNRTGIQKEDAVQEVAVHFLYGERLIIAIVGVSWKNVTNSNEISEHARGAI